MVPVRRSPFFSQTVSATAVELSRARLRLSRESGNERDITRTTEL
jgi:hypothetical protein